MRGKGSIQSSNGILFITIYFYLMAKNLQDEILCIILSSQNGLILLEASNINLYKGFGSAKKSSKWKKIAGQSNQIDDGDTFFFIW